MNRGFIKDYRKELSSDIWLMPPLYHRVWQWIKYTVNHTQGKLPNQDGSFTIIQAGQCPTSYRQIASGVGYYEHGVWKEPGAKTIKTILDWLVGQGMISLEKNLKGTIITVVNWEEHQVAILNGEQGKTKGGNSKETPQSQVYGALEGVGDERLKQQGEIWEQQRNSKETLEGNSKETPQSQVYGALEGVESEQLKQQGNTEYEGGRNTEGVLYKNDKKEKKEKNILKEKVKKEKTELDFSKVPSGLLEEIKTFIDFRKSKKNPMSQQALNTLLNKFKGFTTQECRDAIESAIIGDYASVYPKKAYSPQKKEENKSFTELAEEIEEEGVEVVSWI